MDVGDMMGMGTYLVLDVVQGIWGVDGEAYQNDMRFRVCQRPQALVVLLASCIPESELDRLTIHSAIGYVVLKYGRDLIAESQ
jgi:hypothetical protein